jgi:glutamyl-tRNA synthetase
MKTRIAPTPSGLLHIGNAVSFLITYCLVKCTRGTLLLRIDDLDRERYRKEYVEDIFYSLEWLGIHYDEGPISVVGFEQDWSQHHRLNMYESFLDSCLNKELVYACDCSRKELISSGEFPVYGGKCRKLNKAFSQHRAWRWKMNNETPIQWEDLFQGRLAVPIRERMGDFVVRQRNGYPSYQIGSFLDDVHFKITHIIRGADLINSTAAQLHLAYSSGNSVFPQILFGHHQLITDDKGTKLSKSAGAISLKAWRENGQSPVSILETTRKLLGLPLEKIGTTSDLSQLCMAFNPFSNEKIRSF